LNQAGFPPQQESRLLFLSVQQAVAVAMGIAGLTCPFHLNHHQL